jgi:hypothetical protein
MCCVKRFKDGDLNRRAATRQRGMDRLRDRRGVTALYRITAPGDADLCRARHLVWRDVAIFDGDRRTYDAYACNTTIL